MPSPFLLGKNPLDLVLHQFNVFIYDVSWKAIGLNNGGIDLAPERQMVQVFDGIPRDLVSEIHVDDKFTLSFPLRSFNKGTLEITMNSLYASLANAGLPAPDNAQATLPNASTYDIQHIGMLAQTAAFARTARQIKFEGKRRDGKFMGAKFHKAYIQFPPFNFPNNETNADVNEFAVVIDIFPVNDGTRATNTETGFFYSEQ